MSESPMQVAFVGLGAMGGPMAARLAGDERFTVTAFDTSPAALAAAAAFARPAGSLADAVRDADVVCSMLPADQHVLALGEQLAQCAYAGQLYVDFSTISPSAMRAVADRLATIGVRSVSASCMKSVDAARTGQLALFVGGEDGLIQALTPLFARLATSWLTVGGLGVAKTMKIANNLVTATTGYCLLDGLVLARALGCPADEVARAVAAAGADSWVLRNQIVRHALADDLGPGIFSVRYMAKDVALGVDLARSVGRPALFAALVLAGYRGVVGMGLGDAYHPAVVRWLERAAGTGPVTSPPDSRAGVGELSVLWRGMRAVQQAVLAEVLDIVAATGIDRRQAAELLQTGSAEADGFADFLAGRTGVSTVDLLAARECAEAAGVPALSFEIALQTRSISAERPIEHA
jgi:3-hydroxyisobutyrate dehydrogenase-like beta-hydroxyacid dehydrogenase